MDAARGLAEVERLERDEQFTGRETGTSAFNSQNCFQHVRVDAERLRGGAQRVVAQTRGVLRAQAVE